MAGNVIAEVGLRTGQKIAANVGVKIASSVAAVLTARSISKKIESTKRPLEKYPEEERDKESFKRALRDATIAGVTAAVAGIAYQAAAKVISESDII
jgi:hydrogenase maturation factor